MMILVQIDLSNANLVLFDDYEAKVLALLGRHGATLVERLRTTDSRCEVHLLHFPDVAALDAFRADPVRAALQNTWLQCGASSTLSEVVRYTSEVRVPF